MIEFMEVNKKLIELEPLLKDPSLYQSQHDAQYKAIQKYASDTVKISLFRSDGFMLFSSIEDSIPSWQSSDVDNLYKDLNVVQKNLRTYIVKKPVFAEGKPVGIYELTIGRSTWVEGVNNRTLLLVSLFGGFFILIYVVVVMLLNRKFNRPLQHLRSQMTAFAKGQTVQMEIRTGKDEIGEVLTHFHQMRAQLEQTQYVLSLQQKEKEFIVAALSHDLKTPLTVIQAYAEALQTENKLSEKERLEYRTILFEKLAYMKQMLDDLAVYTALQSVQEKPELVEVDGEEFFDMLLSGYEQPCKDKGISLDIFQCVQSTYDVNVKQMMRVMDNLMANAIRHTDPGKRIWLAAISPDTDLPDFVFPPFFQEVNAWRMGGTLLIIQNQGNAIPIEMQESIFQPFVQGEGARGKGGSSGLGLSVAKMLMEQHDGKIKLWSTAGYGTLVACWLNERKVTRNED
ncbi:sensor histidine kinase [Gottfriedia endophytica]|nr:HAMP domain-containing sensor histidine kinase [Gottfriedia endophytica]